MAKNIVSIEIDKEQYTTRPSAICDSVNETDGVPVLHIPDFNLFDGASILVEFTSEIANLSSIKSIHINPTPEFDEDFNIIGYDYSNSLVAIINPGSHSVNETIINSTDVTIENPVENNSFIAGRIYELVYRERCAHNIDDTTNTKQPAFQVINSVSYADATTALHGLMSASDKKKLDSVELITQIGDGLTVVNEDDSVENNEYVRIIQPVLGDGLTIDADSKAIKPVLGDGLIVDEDNTIQLVLGDGLTVDEDNTIQLVLGDGLTIDADSKAIKPVLGDGLTVDEDNTIQLVLGNGLSVDENNTIQPAFTIAQQSGDNGTNYTFARGDHKHDAKYVQLQSAIAQTVYTNIRSISTPLEIKTDSNICTLSIRESAYNSNSKNTELGITTSVSNALFANSVWIRNPFDNNALIMNANGLHYGGTAAGTLCKVWHSGNYNSETNKFSETSLGLVPKAPADASDALYLSAAGNWVNVSQNVNASSRGTTKTYLIGVSTTETNTTPLYDSNIYMTTSSGTLFANRMESTNGFFETSDERLKNFSEDIDCDLDRLSKLPKKYFRWKDSDDKSLHIGTSAQAVQEIYPELVNENENGDLSVAYDKLSIIALAGIDKLNDKVKSLEERLERLEKLINA